MKTACLNAGSGIGLNVTELAELCPGKLYYLAGSAKGKKTKNEVLIIVYSNSLPEKAYAQNYYTDRSS
jgi:hypothetical protein